MNPAAVLNPGQSNTGITDLRADVNNTVVYDGSPAFLAWCADGCKQGETSGSGTGVPVYFDPTQSAWLVIGTDQPVTN